LDGSIAHRLKEILYISAGGDQSFAVGMRDVADLVLGGAISPNNLMSAQSMMKRQFSTRASHAIVPVNADWLLEQLLIVNSNGYNTENKKEHQHNALNEFLSILHDIFSSSSLLAACFINRNNYLNLDFEGIENCYKAILRLGNERLVLLLGFLNGPKYRRENIDFQFPIIHFSFLLNQKKELLWL
jgi:hypothetical protein